MQIMAEALGLAFPGSALMTATSQELLRYAREAGSTNCLLHIPAIAHELGIEITGDTFERIHRNATPLKARKNA